MARKIFKRAGLRRDKNFSDVASSKQSLNNLLDTLVSDPDASFISEDLDAIRNLFTTGLTPDEYRQFIGSSVRETSIDGSTNAVIPAITYQNRLDKFKVASGVPRLNGGNGLTAKYFNQDSIEDTADIFTGISTGLPIPNDTFWEAGDFQYTRKIHPQSVTAAGGVQWEGFFIPTQTGTYVFNTSSTLGYTVDFEDAGYSGVGLGTYTEYGRVGLVAPTNGSTVSGTINASNRTITIPTATAVNVGIGMTLSQFLLPSGGANVTLGAKVEGVNRDTGVITIESGGIIASGSSNVAFGRPLGESVSTTFNTYPLEKFRRYRIRYRVFVPDGAAPNRDSLRGIKRSITFTFKTPGSISSAFLRYNNLYSLDYDFSDASKGDVNKFLEQSVLFGGNKKDGTERIGASTQPGYVRVETNKKVDIRYEPKDSLSKIERKTISTTWVAGEKIIPISDTTNIEIGNYVFGTGLTSNINIPVRVIDVIINNFIIIDNATTSNGNNVPLTFVDHRGFVKRVTASSTSSGTIQFSANNNTDNLKTKQIAIWNGSAKYTGITTNGSANTIQYDPAGSTFAARNVYFYESRGLIDTALAAFCVPSETKCVLVATAASINDSQIVLNDITGLSGGSRKIQGAPFPSGTLLGTIDPGTKVVQLVDVNGNPAQLLKNIEPNSRFTVTLANEDKTLCCPPTDTSPPFNPTADGLETNLGSSVSLRFNGGNLIFDNLSATVDTTNITALLSGSTNNSTERIELKGGDGVVYNLLCE